MARATKPDVTDADLRSAWCDMRRPGWPASFEEVMEDPIRSRLVRLCATHRLRTEAARKAHPLRVPHSEVMAARWTLHWHSLDVKRAAAGDRDDD